MRGKRLSYSILYLCPRLLQICTSGISIAQPFKAGWKEITTQGNAVHGITRRRTTRKRVPRNDLKNRVGNFIIPSPEGLGYGLKITRFAKLLFVSLLILPAIVRGEVFKAGISDGWDDAYQAGNSFVPDISYIRTGYHDTYGYYYSGFRFQDVSIDSGTTIDSAFLKMYGGPGIVSNVTSTIYGHNVDDSDNFAYSNDSLHERDSTDAKVSWTYGITDGEWNKTPNIASIISEIINLSGWSSGNALSIIIHTTGATDRGSWRSYEYSPDSVCTLSVYWTEASVIEEFTKEFIPTRTTIKCLPNPFYGITSISTDNKEFLVYDITGRLVDRIQVKGKAKWGSAVKSGIYFLKTDNTEVKKLIKLK